MEYIRNALWFFQRSTSMYSRMAVTVGHFGVQWPVVLSNLVFQISALAPVKMTA